MKFIKTIVAAVVLSASLAGAANATYAPAVKNYTMNNGTVVHMSRDYSTMVVNFPDGDFMRLDRTTIDGKTVKYGVTNSGLSYEMRAFVYPGTYNFIDVVSYEDGTSRILQYENGTLVHSIDFN